jgi:hypothetical protein
VESEAAFEEMKRHILFLYDGVTPRHTFLGRDNQFVDCIPIEQQPGLRHPRLGKIPLQMEAPKPSLAAGTIPMRRVTLQEMTRFRTLDEFFAKGRRGSVSRKKETVRPAGK